MIWALVGIFFAVMVVIIVFGSLIILFQTIAGWFSGDKEKER